MARHIKSDNQSVGKLGEDLAATYLSRKGFRIIGRNFKARYGELDIIARDGETLVFVEVKTRIGAEFGTPEEAVTPKKLRDIIRAAEYYVATHPLVPRSLRIDVVGIVLESTTHDIVSLVHTPNVTM